jgi:phosphatidate cytidylyltransferase
MTPGTGSRKWSDLLPRTLSAVLLVPLVLEMVVYGSAWFQLLAGFAGVLMAREYTQIAHQGDDLQFAFHALAALAAVVTLPEAGLRLTLLVVFAMMVLSNIHLAMRNPVATIWQRIGVAYVALPVVALMLVRGQGTNGLVTTLFLLLLVWSADTFAYFAGRIIGGPKLAPRLSPKKTWAGLAGAAVGATLVAMAFLYFGKASGFAPFILLAAALAVIEQGGDIFESSLKRAHNIKDSGSLIPGHGGILDRVDGLLAVFSAAALVGAVRNLADPASGVTYW